jgi:hypothetical protein
MADRRWKMEVGEYIHAITQMFCPFPNSQPFLNVNQIKTKRPSPRPSPRPSGERVAEDQVRGSTKSIKFRLLQRMGIIPHA